MKKSLLFFLLFIILVSQFCVPACCSPVDPDVTPVSAQDASVEFGCYTLDGKAPIMGSQQIIPNMTAAFLYDVDLETVLYALNPDMPIYPASFVKIMTALIAVERGNLSDMVTIKDRVIATIPRSAMTANLQPNEVISLSDLLYCMMVGSANDAASVIADHICGSQEAFVEEMNKKAAELGCKGTVFTNPHGLDEAQQITTARDVAKIINCAMQNPDFMTYFAEEYYVVPATNKYAERSLYTNNYLMYSVDNMRIYRDYRTTGGRTGLDDNGRRCVASTAEDKGRKLICVIFGAESVYDEEKKTTITFGGFKETSDLLTMGFEDYEPMQVLYEGQVFRQYQVSGGENSVVVGSAESAYSVLPVDASASELSFRYFDEDDAFVAPVEKGRKMSTVQIWYRNVCVAETELYAMSDVRLLSELPADKEPLGNGSLWKDGLVAVALIVVGLILLLLIIRCIGLIRMAILRHRRRRYSRNRRRSR